VYRFILLHYCVAPATFALQCSTYYLCITVKRLLLLHYSVRMLFLYYSVAPADSAFPCCAC
jgi:hypothetical protein